MKIKETGTGISDPGYLEGDSEPALVEEGYTEAGYKELFRPYKYDM